MGKDLKTIGEVAHITGISKRSLKYYFDQKIMEPSQKDPGNGKYRLYTDDDIELVRRIALYHELGYKPQEIKSILNDPTFEWQNELDKLIPKLQERRKRVDRLLFAAECMRWIDRMEQGQGEFDISSFDGNIEKSIQSIFEYTSKEKKEIRQAICQGAELVEGEGAANPLIKLLDFVTEEPESQVVQDEIDKYCKLCANVESDFSPDAFLFTVRIFMNLYGTGFNFLVGLYTKQKDFAKFLIDAVQIYCDNQSEMRKELDYDQNET